MDKQALIKALRDTAQSASNAIASNVSGPVDLLAAGLRGVGLPIPQNPMGGSQWMQDRGLTRDVEMGAPRIVGETLGMAGPALAANFAPKIAGALNQGAANLAAPRTLNSQTGAIVWHGSPHKFDKFDSGKIGTGEGAQVYGHGLYLAENKSVADEYSRKLSKPIIDFSKKQPQDKYEMEIAQRLQSLAETTQSGSKYDALSKQFDSYLNPRLEKWNPKHPKANAYNGMAPLEDSDLATAIAYRDAANRLGKFDLGDAGSLYKVDLPDEHIAKMLDWDNAVPEAQRAPISQAALKQFGSGSTGTSGEHLYKEVVKEFERAGHASPKDAATAWLKEQGIPGIRYLDGGSRGAGSGSSNFVVFPGNEDLLKILERNGQAPGMMGIK